LNDLSEETGETHLIVEAIGNVPHMESENDPHGVSDICEASTPDGLLAQHADIQQSPEDKTWPDFVE
jgi:hypothetical protein